MFILVSEKCSLVTLICGISAIYHSLGEISGEKESISLKIIIIFVNLSRHKSMNNTLVFPRPTSKITDIVILLVILVTLAFIIQLLHNVVANLYLNLNCILSISTQH